MLISKLCDDSMTNLTVGFLFLIVSVVHLLPTSDPSLFFWTPPDRPNKYGRIISYACLGFKPVELLLQSPFSEEFEHLIFLFCGCTQKINTGPEAEVN